MAGSGLPVRFRLALIIVWIGIVLGGVALFMTRGDILRNEVLAMSSTSLALGSGVYLLLGCVRGFTLIPVTYLIPLGLVLLPPGLQFVLTLVGILISSASIYYFAEHLRMAGLTTIHPRRDAWRVVPLCSDVPAGRGHGLVRSCPAPSRPTALTARSYAVVRRTRRRGGAVCGAAVRVGWGRPPRGVAFACCAR